jgi:hypothetical protein
MSLSNPFYLDSIENIRTPELAQALPLSVGLPSLRNNFWWVGNFGVSTGITANKNAHDWNERLNWVVWNETGQGSPFIPAPRVPGSLTASSDVVNIGAYTLGPTAYAPLLFGGFSGSSTTGHYSNGVGTTFDAGTTFNNLILSVNIKWEYGAEQKYPWTVVGGGIDVLRSLGVTAGSQTGCSAAPGVTFGEYYNNPRYKNVSLKVRETNEESSRVNNKNIYLNYVKSVVTEYVPSAEKEITQPVGSFYKGQQYTDPNNPSITRWGNSWNEGSSSRSKIWLTGFIHEIVDNSRPSDDYFSYISRTTPAQIKTDYGTTSQGLYGYPAIYIGFADKGCTVGSYKGYNLCPVSVNNNSTLGSIEQETLFSYVTSSGTVNPLVGLPTYAAVVAGEVDGRKSFLALGYTAGQIAGQTSGFMVINTTPQIQYLPSGFGGSPTGITNSGTVNIAVGNPQFGSPGATGLGWTGTSRIINLIVDNSAYFTGDPTNLVLYGGMSAERIAVVNTKVSAYPYVSASMFDIGSLEMFWYSELQLNSAPNINTWKFGVIPPTGSTGAVSGGIFGDETTIIKMSPTVSLYNKSLNRVTSRKGDQKYTTENEVVVIRI